MLPNLTLNKQLHQTLSDRQARFSGMQTSKYANLAGIHVSEWRSALVSSKQVISLGGDYSNIAWADLQILFQDVPAAINYGDIKKQNSAKLATSTLY